MSQEIQYNDKWTSEQIKVAEVTISKAQAFNWLHIRAYKHYAGLARITRFITSACIFLLSTVGIIITNIDIPESASKIAQTVLYGVFILASVITIVLEIWNPSNRATEHYNLAERNKELYQELRTDLIELVTHDQIHQMLTDRLKTELHMRDESPAIPKVVWKKYYRTFGAKALPMEILTCTDDLAVTPITKNSLTVISMQSMPLIAPTPSASIVDNTTVVSTGPNILDKPNNQNINTVQNIQTDNIANTSNDGGIANGSVSTNDIIITDLDESHRMEVDVSGVSVFSAIDLRTTNKRDGSDESNSDGANDRSLFKSSGPRTPSPADTVIPIDALRDTTHIQGTISLQDRYPTGRNESEISLRARSLYTNYARALPRSVNTRTEIERACRYVDNSQHTPRPINVIAIMDADKKKSAREEYEAQRYIENNK